MNRLTVWSHPRRAARCTQCGRKLWRAQAYTERVGLRLVALCGVHAKQGGTA